MACKFNYEQVGDPNDTWIQTFNDSLQSSHSLLRLRLKEYHFTREGIMVLKCTAVISTLYRNSSEVQLVSKAKEPVPERENQDPAYLISGNRHAPIKLMTAFPQSSIIKF
ncbi:hypothetical protein WDU94_004575 [Cyamophila willieti]